MLLTSGNHQRCSLFIVINDIKQTLFWNETWDSIENCLYGIDIYFVCLFSKVSGEYSDSEDKGTLQEEGRLVWAE